MFEKGAPGSGRSGSEMFLNYGEGTTPPRHGMQGKTRRACPAWRISSARRARLATVSALNSSRSGTSTWNT
jgi:hypothetical protein